MTIDSRVFRQTLQPLAALVAIEAPILLAVPISWRAALLGFIGWAVTLVTNPRLVGGLRRVMPVAGSSAVPPPEGGGM